jgi:hypothetical protein
MKKLLLSFGMLLFAVLAFTQISVTVDGYVIDTGGDGVGQVDVYIAVDSLNTFFSYYNTVQTDADGYFSDTFDVPENLSQGAVYISIINCDNNYISQMGYWDPVGGVTVTFLYCNVNCSVQIEENNTGGLTASATGEAPFTYSWNNGANTQSINNILPGNYCVIITDAVGCESSACYYYDPSGGGDTLCYVYILADSVNVPGIGLYAMAEGVAPYSYSWSTGENSQSIIVNDDGEYCVTITDASGCESVDCIDFTNNSCWATVLIGDASIFAEAQGMAPYTYLWNTGQTTQSFVPMASGNYCVTVTDANGCVSTACGYYQFGGSDTLCSVYIVEDSVNVFGTGLLAITDGTAPFTYAWNTGQVTQSIVAIQTANYCVTITDANGCSSSACYYYEPGGGNDTLCYVTIDLVQGGTWLNATASGIAPFTYVWNNNATTASIALEENIVYCVTITDASGCVATACYDNTLPGIQGTVFLPDSINNLLLTGEVNLYALEGDGANLIETTVFSTTNAGGYFAFENLNPGDYILQAILDQNLPESENYLPTYHFSAEFWDEADVISLSGAPNIFYNIMLIPVDPDGAGPGAIGGGVFDEDGFWGGHNDERGDPMSNIEVILHNGADTPVAYVMTGADGTFNFDNLPYGTYTLYVEIPGMEQGEKTIVLGPDNETVNNVAFVVEGSEITTSTREVLLTDQFVGLYPNPAKNVLNVEVNMPLHKIIGYQVVNLTGQVVGNSNFDGGQVDVSILTPGVYILKVQTTDGVLTKQFVKE